MSDHETALQTALIAWLKDDVALRALLGDPARIWDEAPEGAGYPRLTLGRSESRPVGADGCGIEHRLTLTCASTFRGTEEAKAVVAAVRARLQDAALEGGGVRTIGLSVVFSDVFRSADHRRTWAVMRVRAFSEMVRARRPATVVNTPAVPPSIFSRMSLPR